MFMSQETMELAPQPVIKQRMSLYDVGLQGRLIEDALIESGGELNPDLEARFDELLARGPEAIDAGSAIVRELTLSAGAAKEEKDRQASRQKSFESNAASLKRRIRVAVDAAFGGKIKTKRFNLFTSKGRVSTSVEFIPGIDTLEHLHNTRPDLVMRVISHEIDKEAVLKIWAEEQPLRQAHNDALSAWREAVSNTPDGTPLPMMPEEPESKIPKVIQVNETVGDRSLTIK
jgi:hypothetical protein